MQTPPTAYIARGPDGTKGFVLRRTQEVGKEKTEPHASTLKSTDFLSSDLGIGIAAILLTVLFGVLLPWLAATIAFLLVLDYLGQYKPDIVHAIAATSEVAGGLVLVLGAADEGMEILTTAARLFSLGGVLPAGVLILALLAGVCVSRDTEKETTATLGVEERVCVEEEEVTDEPCGNQVYCLDVNPLGANATPLPATAAAAEAGRLRRRAAALLQNKIWDPGG